MKRIDIEVGDVVEIISVDDTDKENKLKVGDRVTVLETDTPNRLSWVGKVLTVSTVKINGRIMYPLFLEQVKLVSKGGQ